MKRQRFDCAFSACTSTLAVGQFFEYFFWNGGQGQGNRRWVWTCAGEDCRGGGSCACLFRADGKRLRTLDGRKTILNLDITTPLGNRVRLLSVLCSPPLLTLLPDTHWQQFHGRLMAGRQHRMNGEHTTYSCVVAVALEKRRWEMCCTRSTVAASLLTTSTPVRLSHPGTRAT